MLFCTNILLILNIIILGGLTGFRAINETTQNSNFFLSITTVVFHRSHYTTISKVGMHKIKYEVKNMKNMLVFALLYYAMRIVLWAVPWSKSWHLLVFSIPHSWHNNLVFLVDTLGSLSISQFNIPTFRNMLIKDTLKSKPWTWTYFVIFQTIHYIGNWNVMRVWKCFEGNQN